MPTANQTYIPPHAEKALSSGREANDVYSEFYRRITLLGTGAVHGGGRQLLGGRVLHFDRTNDRSTHLFVHEAADSQFGQSLHRRDTIGEPYRHYNYYPAAFMVAMTDGKSIQDWRVDRAFGIHRGVANEIDKPFRPENETIFLDIGHDHDGAQIALNRLDGHGTVRLAAGDIGWILDEATSQTERWQRLGMPS